jgi:hypothetical protein
MHQAFTPFALAAGLALAGCETVANVPVPAHVPRLSLAYTLSNQPLTADYQKTFDSRALYVSTSRSILETGRLLGRADASAELRAAAGQVVEQFRARGRSGYGPDSLPGYYVATRGFVGQPGQRYTLRASAPGVAAVEATLTLPAPPTLVSGSYAPVVSSNGYQYRGRLSFAIIDPVSSADYYLAYARVLDAAGHYWGQVAQDYSSRNSNGPDIKLTRFDLSQPGSLFQTLPVSDGGRNGQRLPFSQDVYLSGAGSSSSGNTKPAFIEVIVSSLPADTYEFYQSVQRAYDTEGNPFAEPAPLRSNVVGGYGLFGGATDVALRIAL